MLLAITLPSTHSITNKCNITSTSASINNECILSLHHIISVDRERKECVEISVLYTFQSHSTKIPWPRPQSTPWRAQSGKWDQCPNMGLCLKKVNIDSIDCCEWIVSSVKLLCNYCKLMMVKFTHTHTTRTYVSNCILITSKLLVFLKAKQI